MARKWIQKAVAKMRKKGTEGITTAKAKRAGAFHKGKISRSWLESQARSSNPTAAKRARFALNVRKH